MRRTYLMGPLAVALITGVFAFRFADGRSSPPAPATRELALTEQIADLERRVNKQPDDARLFERLGEAYVQQAVRSPDPAYATKAKSTLDRATALGASPLRVDLARGTLALNQHRFADALALSEGLLRTAPANPDAQAIRIDALIELGRYDDAIRQAQQLVDQRPSIASLTRVAYLRELHGDLDGALSVLRQAEAASVGASAYDRATVAAIRGSTLFVAGRMSEAKHSYETALGIDTTHVLATLGLGRVLAAEGRFDAAVRQVQPLAASTPSIEAYALLAELYAALGDDARAQDAAAKVAEFTALRAASGAIADPDMVYSAEGNDDDRLALARELYARQPSIHGAEVLAWQLLAVGRAAEALPYAKESVRLGTADSHLLYQASVVYLAAGDRDGATALMRRSLAGNPWFRINDRDEVAAHARSLGLDASRLSSFAA